MRREQIAGYRTALFGTYLRRVARSQGYTQLNDFNRWLGWNYGRPLVEELPKVATRLGVELTELEALTPTVNADDPLFE